MTSYHFFERMEREIDFQHEYEKIENIVCNEDLDGLRYSLNSWISKHFRSWKERQNYASFDELRNHLGFSLSLDHPGNFSGTSKNITMKDFFTYIEMVSNVATDLLFVAKGDIDIDDYLENDIYDTYLDADAVFSKLNEIESISRFDINKVGYNFSMDSKGKILIVQNNATANTIADHVEPALADTINEYNHYILKGNIERKKELLISIASNLEGRKTELGGLNNSLKTDFFNLINNFNLRHNNISPAESSYKPQIASLSDEELETAYDLIYEEALMCFMTLEQVERNQQISELKRLYVKAQ